MPDGANSKTGAQMLNLSRDLRDLLEGRVSDGYVAYDIIDAAFAKLIAALRRDPRFATIPVFELELLLANLRGEIGRELFNEMTDRVHLDDATNAVDLVLGEPEYADH
jgi:hypothetical protein